MASAVRAAERLHSAHRLLSVLRKGVGDFATVFSCPSTDRTSLLSSVNIMKNIDLPELSPS